MKSHDGPQTPFEVFCHECRVTFPAGTRRCVHCGTPIARSPFSRTGRAQAPNPDAIDGEEMPEISLGRRLGGVSLWLLLAFGAGLARLCGG